ncbi:hypothetical protein [Streptomyces sp. UNOC14_S4]|uniref:hypothetical protein n=1 Tax=Streptomyces sp. UNOC14_S4 TaxID=2872340 RepID=UPI001E3BAAD6|nr:hypothetical protein [Streptomyces sp. UNOC14_S4]MCC3766060.1 hypothetical protein [Streptomyces sp. UNOC14_S4]
MDQNTLTASAEPETSEAAIAQSPVQADAHADTPTRTYTDDDLERARKQEKDKLYSRMSAQEKMLTQLQEELATQRAAREAEQKAKDEAAQKAAEEAEAKRKAELSAKALVEEQRHEFEARLAAMEEQRQKEQELYAKERAWQELQQYKTEAIAAAQNDIAPELLDLIAGDDKPTVDASIEAMKAKSAQIAASVQQAQVQARANMRGTSATGYGVGSGGIVGEVQELSAEQIRNMPMAEYVKRRTQQGMPGSVRASGQGLFG